MLASVLTIGTELTRGEVVNTNAAWIASELTDLGFEVLFLDTVDDDLPRIQQALERLSQSSALVICTGGLGPTTDDVTTLAVARTLGRPLVRDPGSFAAITERLQKRGRAMTESNAKQADFPEGATVLPNRVGSAPGFAIDLGGARVFCLQGVPVEMRTLFAEYVVPAVRNWVTDPPCQLLLRTLGLAESAVNDRLTGLEQRHGVTIGYRARSPEVEVKVLARGAHAAEAARAAATEVLQLLGEDVVYAEGNVTLSEVVGQQLLEQGLTLGCAESCTGGLVSSLLTADAGASRYFLGSVVSYANSVKEHVLGVPREVLREHGAVSEAVARSMAEGARRVLGVDVALALTGIAGPEGGTPEKPVGLVYLAVATPSGTHALQAHFPGARAAVQRSAAFAGLALVRRVLGAH